MLLSCTTPRRSNQRRVKFLLCHGITRDTCALERWKRSLWHKVCYNAFCLLEILCLKYTSMPLLVISNKVINNITKIWVWESEAVHVFFNNIKCFPMHTFKRLPCWLICPIHMTLPATFLCVIYVTQFLKGVCSNHSPMKEWCKIDTPIKFTAIYIFWQNNLPRQIRSELRCIPFALIREMKCLVC